RMPPVFKENGSVTAANACPVNDGAAISLVMSREKCDALGLTPALRFVDAQAAGVEPEFLGIGPVPAVQKVLARQQMDISSDRKMPPVFKENGSVTAANACPVNDGAAISLVMSREKCDALGLTPALRFVDAQAAGVEPEFLGIGPVPAVQKVLARQQMDIS